MRALTWRKRWLFSGVLGLLLLVAAEGLCGLALALQGGGWGPRPWAAERARVAGEASAELEALLRDRVAPPTGAGQAIHPFLGFVQDADSPENPWPLTAQGFPRVPVDPPGSTEEGAFVVALFGGSVAHGVCTAGYAALLRELRRFPALATRPIALHCYATGGIKQPQQLMTLNWVLSLGEVPDLVLLLDGFNELAMSAAVNAEAGVYPFYPQAWQLRVGGAQTSGRLLGIGELAYLRRQRREGASLCSAWPWRWSASCHLLWTVRDRRAAAEIHLREAELRLAKDERRTFLTHGPTFEPASAQALYGELAVHWARCATQMAQLCAARGIAFAHFLQPNQYVPGSKPMSAAERRVALDPAQPFRPAVELGYPFLRTEGEALRRSGLPFWDLTGLLARTAEPAYADSCCHFNQLGYDLLAAEMGRLARRGLERSPAPGAAPP